MVGEFLSRRFRTNWGEGRITIRDGRLVGVELPPLDAETGAEDRRTAGQRVSSDDIWALETWVEALESYFRGERLSWSEDEVPLHDLGVGRFEEAVYSALVLVPAATTVSYGELAAMAGHPRAARAVGNAMASNPVPIVIPCHRVIRADGTLGRYGRDPAWKERLLQHERRFAGKSRSSA